MLGILKELDTKNVGTVSMSALLPYINEDVKNVDNEILIINWPEWLIVEGKLFSAKEILLKILDSVRDLNISPLAAFKSIDMDNEDSVDTHWFRKTLEMLYPKITNEEL